MQIAPRPSQSGSSASSVSGSAGSSAASKIDAATLTAPAGSADTSARSAPAPLLRRGLSNWDQPLQSDISGAQQAIDFLEQSAAQLRSLKSELSAKLASRQMREGQVEQRVRQFSDTWRSRQQSSGGTLDSQLSYSTSQSSQRFTARGMTLANLRSGPRETLAISVGGGSQGLRSVALEPGLSDGEIVQRFDQALAPVNIRVSVNGKGELEFTAPEAAWGTIRDTLAVQGNGVRYPAGQLNRVRVEQEAPLIMPEQWQAVDAETLRETLKQVVQALAHVEAALAKVNLALSEATMRAAAAMPEVTPVNMDQAALNFASAAQEPGYAALLSLSSALVGINRERVLSLLGLR